MTTGSLKSDATTSDPGRPGSGSALRSSIRWARQRPFAVGYAAALLAVGLATGVISGPARSIRLLLGTGYESVIDHGHWWSPLTSVFFVDNGAELLLALAGTLIVLGFAERLMGTCRTAIAFLVTAILGATIGIGAQFLGVAGGEMWSRGVSELWAMDPFTPIFGSALAASFFAGPLCVVVFVCSGCRPCWCWCCTPANRPTCTVCSPCWSGSALAGSGLAGGVDRFGR